MKRLLAVLFLAAACRSSDNGAVAADGNELRRRSKPSVQVQPSSATLPPGANLQFTAAVSNMADASLAWSVRETDGGSVTQAGLYTAPAGAGTYHVVATSQAKPYISAESTVSVAAPVAVSVSIAPAAAAVRSCQSVALTATVTGASDTSVTWSVQEANGGTVSASGVYTAPSNAGTYHAVATSNADPSKSAAVAIAVTDQILSVSVAPTSKAAAPGGAVQFTASVTTTCGTYPAVAAAP